MPPFANKFNSIIRGVVKLVDDTKKIQVMQVSMMANQTRSKLQRLQNYGFSSKPLPGAETLVMFIGGSHDNGVVMGTDDGRYRPKNLKDGETIIYNDKGTTIHLKESGDVEITTAGDVINNCVNYKIVASEKIILDAPVVEATNNIIDNTSSGNTHSIASQRTAYNTHTHVENDDGGPTDPPNNTLD